MEGGRVFAFGDPSCVSWIHGVHLPRVAIMRSLQWPRQFCEPVELQRRWYSFGSTSFSGAPTSLVSKGTQKKPKNTIFRFPPKKNTHFLNIVIFHLDFGTWRMNSCFSTVSETNPSWSTSPQIQSCVWFFSKGARGARPRASFREESQKD